ncbi:MAG TPA: hypothetical protein PLB35_10590 [Myxococcota bacterium]|nr:hypothetical protein [Myxococcota bacterium]
MKASSGTRSSSWRIQVMVPALLALLPTVSCGNAPDPEADVTADQGPVEVTYDEGTLPDGVIDNGAPDTGRDLIAVDIQPDGIVPGGFGAPCDDYDDCDSRLCVEAEGGSICTKLCLQEGCPEGFVCSGITNTYPDALFLCMPVFSKVCSSCTFDNQCAGGKCVQFPEGKFCTVPCETTACPSDYQCVDADGGQGRFCVPPSGSCLCRKKDEGTRRACEKTNEIGTCYGYESCDPEVGFTACDASLAKAEECNGLDDDCDGSPDDGLDEGESCLVENEFGACQGTSVCFGLKGWICGAKEPEAETCNGIDDDCDGETDEDFKVDGAYGSLENCGACNKSCIGIFPNATVDCDATGPVPRCIVTDCDDGFFKLNDYQCIPLTSTICNTCVIDSDCIIEGARCVEFADGGRYCGHPCENSGNCPTGYSCVAVPGGDDQCLPDSGSCACDTPDPNITRVCQVSWQENPESPLYTCSGIQRCGEGGWSDCELPAEQCNGQDDNCNGEIDEGFLTDGRYTSNTNCGVCANNCTTMSVTNGFGVCDTSRTIPDCKVECNNGFFNVDGNPANGCECQYKGAVDLPGGGDDDCDGIDGSTEGAVFVAKWGADTNPGTIEQPVLTIARGMQLADGAPARDVYVATGIYTEPLNIREGVSVYGGFSADFKILNPIAYETVILGQEPIALLPGAVNAVSINGQAAGSTVLSGFVVIAYNNRTAGQNSIGIYIKDCDSSLAVRDCRIVGGLAGNGAAGGLGVSGEDGVGGAAGLAAYDINTANCGTTTRAGGQGGTHSCGTTPVGGGSGGTAICPDFDEDTTGCATGPTIFNPDRVILQTRKSNENGTGGLNGGGAGGIAGLDSIIDSDCSYSGSCGSCSVPSETRTGAAGMPGNTGTDGGGGNGCTNTSGNVVDGLWVPAQATGGGTGAHGSGGGGGGAAGGVETLNCGPSDGGNRGYTDLGGSGGGGGSGGCGATGGTPGGSGGGSFGIFVAFTTAPTSVPDISGVRVQPGQGGIGGNGGAGGVGGKGGAGALGGADGAGVDLTFCAAGGGAGGNGGAGGHGGGGGGGCGGPAYGIFMSGADPASVGAWKTSVTFLGAGEGGAGGTGGTSFGADGTNGSNGIAANTNF